MANTVFGPYSPTTWIDNTTQGTHVTLGNLETQAGVALNGFNGDLLSAFVLSGMVCTKDGSTVNQLDVSAGRAYATMTDGTRGLIITAASIAAQFTTATPSTTYYLFLLNTGAWQWGTTSTGPANSLAICQVTTDASGNISTVTDTRNLSFTLFPAFTPAGTLSFPGNMDVAGNLTVGSALAIGGSIAGPAGAGIPTTRNISGTATAYSVPIYTGYIAGANPLNPPTGSMRIDA